MILVAVPTIDSLEAWSTGEAFQLVACLRHLPEAICKVTTQDVLWDPPAVHPEGMPQPLDARVLEKNVHDWGSSLFKN